MEDWAWRDGADSSTVFDTVTTNQIVARRALATCHVSTRGRFELIPDHRVYRYCFEEGTGTVLATG